ncbi:hypothetical protein WR25_16261 [Diploscapter pachys]|uniref:Uncharacterized protein n=1 Tax=Diploscapter pachys TaxID=2018661 RepID=A0A2A2L8E9_9BILA|nr:hypothetical protein WR25_16261 [Diploscapter pachys]
MIDSDKKVARLAGIEYVPIVRNEIERSKSLCEIIKTKALLKRLVFFWIMWFITAVSGFATDLYSNTIAGDFYINQIIFCLFIINSKWIIIYFDVKYPAFNRRVLHQGSQFIVVSLFSVITVMRHFEYSLAHLTTIWPPFVYAVVVALGTFELILSCLFLEESKGVDLDKVRLEDDELVGLKLGKVYPAKRECTMMKANIE